MDAHERVDARDLEHASDARARHHDEVEPLASLVHALRGRREHAHAGRVEERASAEVDHELPRIRPVGESLLEDGHGGEVELADDVNDDALVRLLHSYVKIAGRGHEGRV